MHQYYSVDKFKTVYAGLVMPMTYKNQWPRVDLGFRLWLPILKRAVGKPRNRRYKGCEEGGSSKRTTRCKRCEQFGYMKKTCDEPINDPYAPPPKPPKPKRKRSKLVKKTVTSKDASPILYLEFNRIRGPLTKSQSGPGRLGK